MITRDAARSAAARFAIAPLLVLACASDASAHGVSGRDALFLQNVQGSAIGPLMYLGAKHMVTGYDHLAFLVGVIFFLYRLKDVALYVSLFTIGHSVTLLAGVLGGIRANPYIIDAIIGFSVVYKAFDNMDGFKRFFGFQPDTRAAVLVFGLFHGFGLATKLQDFALSSNGLVANIVSFNVGVEIGQGIALTFVLIGLSYWRTRSGFLQHAFVTNGVLMACGFLLVGYQLSGYFLGSVIVAASIETTSQAPAVMARERVALAFGAALLVAGLLLVVAVLPAEYGVDPLGVGRMLGLTAIGDLQKNLDAFQATRAASASDAATVAPQDRSYQHETVEFTLAPDGFVEYKYRLAKGDALLYSWKATGPVNYELHAEPDGAPQGYAESFEKKDAQEAASGTLTAPFPGIHGWYWQNPGKAPVTVTLSAAGFYRVSYEFRKDEPTKTRMFQ